MKTVKFPRPNWQDLEDLLAGFTPTTGFRRPAGSDLGEPASASEVATGIAAKAKAAEAKKKKDKTKKVEKKPKSKKAS